MNVAVILAAGESRRMGQPKQLLPFGGKTMLGCVIDAFCLPDVDEILVVLGHQADEIGVGITHARCRIVKNPRYQQGMFTSIQAGLRKLPAQAKLVMIALCDQPRLRAATVEKLMTEFEKEHRAILIPMHEGRQGHPLLFRAEYAKEILAMDESLTLKHFLASHAEEISRLPVSDEGVLLDIDDRADYQRALRQR